MPKRLRSQLSSWVMLAPTSTPPFTPLPNEQNLFTSPPRIALSLSTPTHYPGKQQQPPFNLSSSSGTVYLTNRRIIYLPASPTEKLQSFAAPILNLHDSHVTAPFFGPNVWLALLQPVQGGGIPTPSTGVVELKLTFKEGGAFDFHTQYERVKERLQHAMEVAHMNGDGSTAARSGVSAVDTGNVHLEDLPAYQEESDGPLMPAIIPAAAPVPVQQQRDSGIEVQSDNTPRAKPQSPGFAPPVEPPPGYDEVQRESVQEEVERRLSEGRI